MKNIIFPYLLSCLSTLRFDHFSHEKLKEIYDEKKEHENFMEKLDQIDKKIKQYSNILLVYNVLKNDLAHIKILRSSFNWKQHVFFDLESFKSI